MLIDKYIQQWARQILKESDGYEFWKKPIEQRKREWEKMSPEERKREKAKIDYHNSIDDEEQELLDQTLTKDILQTEVDELDDTEYTVDDYVTIIGEEAFRGYDNLKKIILPDSFIAIQ